jgi:hypothetical protein
MPVGRAIPALTIVLRQVSGHGLVTDATNLPLLNVTRRNLSHAFSRVTGLSD